MQLDFDLVNRVRNVSLAESPSNALLPVFEAISNSVHAIENRFRSSSLASGRIDVAIEVDRKQRVPTVTIADNGIGLNRENWKSFTTSDSPHKLRRGGKGVGRLSWLKVFDYAEVQSTYSIDNGFERIEFELHLDNANPIGRLRREKIRSGHRGTTVVLHDMKSVFASALPKKASTVARRIAGHFPIARSSHSTKQSVVRETSAFGNRLVSRRTEALLRPQDTCAAGRCRGPAPRRCRSKPRGLSPRCDGGRRA